MVVMKTKLQVQPPFVHGLKGLISVVVEDRPKQVFPDKRLQRVGYRTACFSCQTVYSYNCCHVLWKKAASDDTLSHVRLGVEGEREGRAVTNSS